MPHCPTPAKGTPAVSHHQSHLFWETTVGHFLLGASSCTLYTILFLYSFLFRILLGFHVWCPFQTVSLLKSECFLVGSDLSSIGHSAQNGAPTCTDITWGTGQVSTRYSCTLKLRNTAAPITQLRGTPTHKDHTVNSAPCGCVHIIPASWRTGSSWVLCFMSIPSSS